MSGPNGPPPPPDFEALYRGAMDTCECKHQELVATAERERQLQERVERLESFARESGRCGRCGGHKKIRCLNGYIDTCDECDGTGLTKAAHYALLPASAETKEKTR